MPTFVGTVLRMFNVFNKQQIFLFSHLHYPNTVSSLVFLSLFKITPWKVNYVCNSPLEHRLIAFNRA